MPPVRLYRLRQRLRPLEDFTVLKVRNRFERAGRPDMCWFRKFTRMTRRTFVGASVTVCCEVKGPSLRRCQEQRCGGPRHRASGLTLEIIEELLAQAPGRRLR